MSCEPGNFGSPAMARCSQVTWLRSWLLNTQKTNGAGPPSRSRYRFTVIISFMPFIWNAPSPTKAMTGRSG